jgi:hypothetical protein
MSDTLTIADAVHLNTVLTAAQGNRRVARLMPDDSPLAGKIIEGTARRVGDDRGCSVHGADVRDLMLWVTTTSGFETFWPVRDLMSQVPEGAFVITD